MDKGITQNNNNNERLLAVLKSVMNKDEDYVFIKDVNSVYLYSSASFAKMAGQPSPESLIGKTDHDIFPKDIADKYVADDKIVLETGRPIEGVTEKLPEKDGADRWTKTWKRPINDADGNLIGIYGIGRDITKVMDLEEQVKSAGKYMDLIRRIPGGIAIMHESNGAVVLDYANEGYFNVHFMSRAYAEKFINSDMTEIVYEPDRYVFADEFRKIKEGEHIKGNLTFRIIGEDKKPHWINMQFNPAHAEGGLQYYYASFVTLDELKETEARLEENSRALSEAVENSDIQFFTYFIEEHRCEVYVLNSRVSNLPSSWDNFPDDFLKFTGVSAEDAKAYRDMLKKIDNGEEYAECTLQVAYNGVYTWEKVSLKAVRDVTGKIVKAQGYSINVTAKKKAEEKIQRERVRLKTLEGDVVEAFTFNLTKNSEPEIRTSDEEFMTGEIDDELEETALRISPPIGNIHSKTREILLRAAARIPDKRDRELFLSTCSGNGMLKAYREGRYNAEIRYRRKINDLTRWVYSTAEILPDPESGDMVAFFYTGDITDDVVYEKISNKIARKNYRLISYLDMQTNRLYMKMANDPDDAPYNNVTFEEGVSGAIKQFAKDSETEGLSEKFSLDTIKAQLEKMETYAVYYRRVNPDSDEFDLRMKTDMFYLDENKDIIVFLFSDVTDIFEQERENREKMEAALVSAEQASAAKSNFLSRMSHEIRTPLNAIIGMDTIAAQSFGNQEKEADCISKIGISARYLLSLINDILDMSRIESGKMLLKNEKFLFRDFISNINTIIYNQTKSKGLDYECTVSDSIAEAYIGDAMKLQQVLINILGNAVKFTEKGKISFDIHSVSEKGSNSTVRFTVNDTGIGIKEEFLEHIFEPFEQSDTSTTTIFGGTGLGLAITKNLVTLMGGNIRVRSIVGVGSEFTVDIPLTIDESVLIKPKINCNFEKMNALIVDDDLVVCEQTNNVLKDIGMRGDWVTTGREAVEKVRVNFERSEYYDFILVDWKMPEMDGFETTRQIRKIVGPEVTIIIITAYDWQSIESEAKAAGANMLVSKPLLRTTLVSAFLKAKGEAEKETSIVANFDFKGKRILVAEDNQINADIAKTLLENKNFAVEIASNGLKALEMYTTNPAYYYDAILMDIRMPLMDGLQATANIRHWSKEDAKTISIIAMTANAFDEDVEKSRSAGMNAHISKPVEPDLMYNTLYRTIYEED